MKIKNLMKAFWFYILVILFTSCNNLPKNNTSENLKHMKYYDLDSTFSVSLTEGFNKQNGEIPGRFVAFVNENEFVTVTYIDKDFDFNNYVNNDIEKANSSTNKLKTSLESINDTLAVTSITGSGISAFQAFEYYYLKGQYLITATSLENETAKNYVLSFKLLALNTDEFQIFKNDGFKIKCNYKLQTNTVFIELAKQQGINNLQNAYVCSSIEDNPENGFVSNINIYDYNLSSSEFLKQYENDLKNAKIKFNYTTLLNLKALEYLFDQQGVPTKAVVFINNNKSYLIQVAAKSNIDEVYKSFISGFKLL